MVAMKVVPDDLMQAYRQYMAIRLKLNCVRCNIDYHREKGDDLTKLYAQLAALRAERDALPITVYQVKQITAAENDAIIHQLAEIAVKCRPTYEPPKVKRHRYDMIIADIKSGINDDSILCRHAGLTADVLAVYHKIIDGTLANLQVVGARHCGTREDSPYDEGLTFEQLGYTAEDWAKIPVSTRWKYLHPKRSREYYINQMIRERNNEYERERVRLNENEKGD